jgi:hypothetical protein
MVCGVLTPQAFQDLAGHGRLSTAVDHDVAPRPGAHDNLRVAEYVGWGDDRTWTRLPPADEAADLEWTLYHQEDVITRRQALAGMSVKVLRHLVNSGRWRRLRRGLFVAHSGLLTERQRRWAATLACGDGAVLGGLTAACAGGLRRSPGMRLHLLVPAAGRPNQPGRAIIAATALLPTIVAHRTTQLPDKDLDVARPPRTSMARSLVDAAQWAASDDEARAIVAAGCQQRLTTPEEIFAVLQRMPRARRRGIVREVIGYAASGAEWLSEMNFDKLCRANGLPRPDRQVPRRDDAGRPRYLDAYWRKYGVHAEVDGGVHSEPEVWWADQFRQNDLWIDDEIVVRFPAWAIANRPDQVARQLRRALIRGGWRP